MNGLKEFYTKERSRVIKQIDAYIKNYGVEVSQDGPRGIPFDEYEKARFNICKIEDESVRMQQTALLQIRRLNGHLDSLDKVLAEIEKNEKSE